jgi:hypothetical protein
MTQPDGQVPDAPEALDAKTQDEPPQNLTELPEWARKAIEKGNAEAARYRTALREESTRAKANATAAERLAALEESQKTEAQKVAERAELAEKRAAESERDLARYKVAVLKKLPAELAERLRGDTAEELAADADALLALLKTTTDLKPDPSQGNRTSASAAPDMNSLLRAAAGRG